MPATREYRVSPDGDNIAVRSDFPADGPMAFGVMNALNGGYWASEAQLSDWGVVDNESVAYPEPEAPEEPTP